MQIYTKILSLSTDSNIFNIDLQYYHFEPMIPEAFQSIWKKSLNDDKLALKLCGAGGGGFILGFSKDWESTQQMLSDYTLQTVLYL